MQGKYELYENKTYIELFIKLRKANEEVYLFKFGNEFNKTRIALWKQINNLIEKNMLKKELKEENLFFFNKERK